MTLSMLHQLNVDLEPLGLLPGDDSPRYFCTPKNARILFRTGVDGVHYCRVRGYGGTIFAVEPMGEPGEMVYPVAKSLEDFLRLVLACGGEAAVQQCRYWDRGRFEEFRAQYPPDPQALAVIEPLHLTPMEDPYGYVSILQSEFDLSTLEFPTEYYDVLGLEQPAEPDLPPWEVYYESDFWGRPHDHSQPGREISLQRSFRWADRDWYIPAVYVCSQGLVADVCQSAEIQQLQAFIDKWNLLENDGRDDAFTPEQREQIERENPLHFDYNAEITINGKVLRQMHGIGIGWIPCVLDQDSKEIKAVMTHYELDPARGWFIKRIRFPWAPICDPEICTLSITLSAAPVDYTAGRFTTVQAGESHTFINPTNEQEYTLTVCTLEQGKLEEDAFQDETMEYPLCYTIMEYTVFPEVRREQIHIQDCSQGDSPRRKGQGSHALSSAAGMIVMRKNDDVMHGTVSSLAFAPQSTVEWRVIFHETEHEPVTIELI